MITQIQMHTLFIYKDGFLYYKVRVNKMAAGSMAGGKHHSGYFHIKINGKLYRTHRIIFLMFYGYLPKQVDHKDRDKSNNKIENLRASTHSQNMCNSVGKTKTSATGLKGVSFRPNRESRNKYQACITLHGKRENLGAFYTAEEAAKAYDARAVELHGEFSLINFPLRRTT